MDFKPDKLANTIINAALIAIGIAIGLPLLAYIIHVAPVVWFYILTLI